MQLRAASNRGMLVNSFQYGSPIPRGTGFGWNRKTRVKLAGEKGSDGQLLCLS